MYGAYSTPQHMLYTIFAYGGFPSLPAKTYKHGLNEVLNQSLAGQSEVSLVDRHALSF